MISLFSFFTIIQELCTCNNLILKSSVLLLDPITGGSDLDPATHGLQHDSRIGLKSFDGEESNPLRILCYKETPEGLFCFFAVRVPAITCSSAERATPSSPTTTAPDPPILLTHTPPPETKKKNNLLSLCDHFCSQTRKHKELLFLVLLCLVSFFLPFSTLNWTE